MIQHKQDNEFMRQLAYCAYCDKALTLKEGVDMITTVEMNFNTYEINTTTGIPANIQTMSRNVLNMMCPECTVAFLQHLQNFNQNYSPTLNAAQPFVQEHLDAKDIPAPMIAKTFNAVEGSQLADKKHEAPPLSSEDAPADIQIDARR